MSCVALSRAFGGWPSLGSAAGAGNAERAIGGALQGMAAVVTRRATQEPPSREGPFVNAIFKPKLIAGNSNRPLATAIARRISMHRGETVELVKTRVERFNDAEIFVEVYENVRGEDMFIIQSTSNPANDNLMELLIMCDALRRRRPTGSPR